MDDFGRLDTLIKPAKSCIFYQNANKNILLKRDTSRCGQTNCEESLKCHNFVTLDSSVQSARFHIPLQNSAVGINSPVPQGAQSPKYNLGDFFCARLAWLQMVAGQGHLRVRRFLVSGLLTLSGPPPCLTAGLVGNKCHTRSPMLEPNWSLIRLCILSCFGGER